MPEGDFAATCAVPERPTFLAGTSIELLRTPILLSPPRHALFDFDGTLSLVREGWMEIMVPMMVEFLLPCAGNGETPASLEALVRDFVSELTGKQTIYQMMRFVEEIRLRGGTPLEAQAYKDEYHSRLMARIAERREGLASGKTAPEEYLVPGSLDILKALRSRDVAIYIASGTDEAYVIEEARLLGLEGYAPGRIYGAQKDHLSFSKEMVIRRILSENHVEGASLLAFGDGYVEISDCKAAGGMAIAVASDEAGRSGKADPWKRGRLIAAGADLVIPDYREAGTLVDWIWSHVGAAAFPEGAAAVSEGAAALSEGAAAVSEGAGP